jgi:hypothetical protein
MIKMASVHIDIIILSYHGNGPIWWKWFNNQYDQNNSKLIVEMVQYGQNGSKN